MKPIRITKPLNATELKLTDTLSSNEPLSQWLELSIEDLSHRLRYSKEETQVLQGAIRALVDLQDVLKR